MPKNTTTSFVCSSCGYDSTKWYGKCPECGEWNTMKEINLGIGGGVSRGKAGNSGGRMLEAPPKKLSEVEVSKTVRISTGFSEFDRVLGQEVKAGIVPGSVVLLSGDPGIGKSTILLQIALFLAKDKKILYITGEESEAQVTLRAQRLIKKEKLDSLSLFILATSDIDSALEHARKSEYALVIIDSIQTMQGGQIPGYAGSIPQVRHATGQLVNFAKGTNIPVIIIGHVTKEGMVAGPQMLSHMVDTVLYLEGEKMTGVRILRSFKNRFGDTSEVGIFEMREYGLSEVTDLSDLFLGEAVGKPGSCIAILMEGSRPIVVEIQALTIHSNMPYSKRVASGISEKRLELLLAILQKHAKLPLEKYDVFVNVAGGFKVSETAADLAVCLAVMSSFKGMSLSKTAAIAEVGLLGEIKKVVNLKKREQEAKKFKFRTITAENATHIGGILAKF